MSFSKSQGNDTVCYTKPLDSLKGWNDHFFWFDAFACPATFPWHTSKSVSKDPFPKSSEFNAEHYATLVAYPAPFQKYPEPFLCLVGMSRYYTLDENTYPEFLHDNDEGGLDLLAFIRTANPTKVMVGERQCTEDEPKLLDTTVGRVVPLLPVAPTRASSELEASVDKIFDEGGSGDQAEQGDSASGRQGVGIQLVSEAAETIVEDVAPLQPRRQKKRKTTVADAGEPLHLVKRLRDDHGTPVRGGVVPALPFVTSSVSATPDHEGEDHTDSVVGTNLRAVGPPQMFVISLDSSYHSGANVMKAEVDSVVRSSIPMMTVATIVTSTIDPATTVREKFVEPSRFGGGSSSAGGADHTMGGFSDLTGSDFIISGIRTVISPDTDLQKVYVHQWSVTNGSRLDDNRAARQMSLSAEVRMRAEYNIEEKRRLKSVVDEQTELLKDEVQALKEHNVTLEKEKNDLDMKVADLAALVKVKEREVADLDVVVTSVKSQNDNLIDQVHGLEASSSVLQEKVTVYEGCIIQLEKFQDDRIKEVNDKFDNMYTDFVEMAFHLEERFYPYLFTTISGYRWLLTHGMELAITKCMNSLEYLSVLRTSISKAIEKGMHDGLSAGITHGKEGRALIDVAAYNPSVEADYISALQQLQHVNFSLFAELRSNKDASIEDLMSILHLEDVLVEKLGLGELQPHVDQLMVPIHHFPDKNVIGATALSLALDPLSVVALEGMQGTSDAVTSAATTMALSTTLVSTSTVNPISIDDYEVVEPDDQALLALNYINDTTRS
ncbi:hypothetical protein Tco_0764624 [Tanacetum coccineum]